jgi:hypothetical protein
MLVSELYPGLLIKLSNDYRYFLQGSRKSDLPRLRTAPDVIVSLINSIDVQLDQEPIMYLGETKEHILTNKNKKLRTVMVDGQVAFIEGREFSRFKPISSESS